MVCTASSRRSRLSRPGLVAYREPQLRLQKVCTAPTRWDSAPSRSQERQIGNQEASSPPPVDRDRNRDHYGNRRNPRGGEGGVPPAAGCREYRVQNGGRSEGAPLLSQPAFQAQPQVVGRPEVLPLRGKMVPEHPLSFAFLVLRFVMRHSPSPDCRLYPCSPTVSEAAPGPGAAATSPCPPAPSGTGPPGVRSCRQSNGAPPPAGARG